jgi:hypothetical protein
LTHPEKEKPLVDPSEGSILQAQQEQKKGELFFDDSIVLPETGHSGIMPMDENEEEEAEPLMFRGPTPEEQARLYAIKIQAEDLRKQEQEKLLKIREENMRYKEWWERTWEESKKRMMSEEYKSPPALFPADRGEASLSFNAKKK